MLYRPSGQSRLTFLSIDKSSVHDKNASHNFSGSLGLRKQAIDSNGTFDALINENNISLMTSKAKRNKLFSKVPPTHALLKDGPGH